jgi:uncharacterized damage-inducible protein DinB
MNAGLDTNQACCLSPRCQRNHGAKCQVNVWSNMYRHHRWSNLVMIEFLVGLTELQLRLEVPSTYGSSIDTIRHLVSSDADYVRIIPDTPEVPQCAQDGPFGGWDELRTVADTAGTVLIAYVDGLSDDMFFIDVDDGEEFTLAKSMLLSQIIHHATEHRSQIRTTLSTHGIIPPEISLWAWRESEEGQAVLAELATLANLASEV